MLGAAPECPRGVGGGGARVLLLLETPGPAIGRTGFVSIDNATGTSANLRRFLAAAGLDRQAAVIWNAVPWVIHTGGPNRAPKLAEIRAGLAALPGLLPLLPRLRCAVLAGRTAGLAEQMLQAAGLPVIRIPHPSPTYVCTSPDIPARIVAGLAAARSLASPPPLPAVRSPAAPARLRH